MSNFETCLGQSLILSYYSNEIYIIVSYKSLIRPMCDNENAW